MKILIQNLAILFAMLSLYSCDKEYDSTDNVVHSQDEQISQRSSGVECLSCDAISVSQQLLVSDGQCGTTRLTIELLDPDCNAGTRHIVKANGEVLTFFTSRVLELELEHCDISESTITVHGYDSEKDNWDLLCYREHLSAGSQLDQLAPSYEALAVE